MIVNSQRRTLARHLRSQGLSYRKIQKQVGSSLDSIFRWCKDISNEQTNEQVRENPTLTVNRIDSRGRDRVRGKNKTDSTGIYKGKTGHFPTWLGVTIIVIIVIAFFIAMWLRQPDPEPEQVKSKKRTNEPPRPPDGLDGRNLADLDTIEDLPGEEF